MTCLIIEDQPPAQRILRKYISDIGTLELRGVYTDALRASEHLRGERVELLFLDINLPKLGGLEFLKTLSDPPAVILTTAHSEYALEGYDLDVVDYLLKPFSFPRFVKAVHRVDAYRRPSGGTASGSVPDHLFLKSGYEHLRVEVDAIRYLQAGSDYTELVTADKKHLSPESLRYWLDRLGDQDFVQVHRSYAVNLARVQRVIGNEIFLDGRERIPIGRAYRETFLRRLG